jgi:transposase-like protein
MLVFLEGCSENIGGPNRIVEIDESKFGRRKYHRGHPLQVQWVFGGIERGSGRLFLVPVPDRTPDTLEDIIHDRIETGTTVISDCWGAYSDLDSLRYTHSTVNHILTPGTTPTPLSPRSIA